MEKLMIADANGDNPLHLHGAEVNPPVVGARREEFPRRLSGGLVEECIEVALHGEGIRAVVQSLEEKFTASQNRVKDACLFLQSESSQNTLSARILSGQIELLAGGLQDRKRSLQILRLRIVRSEPWEDLARALFLSNQNGAGVWNGLAIRNHCDATSGHQNFVDAGAEEVGGTQPCPVEVRLILPAGFASTLQDCYLASGFDLSGASGSFNHVLEGEAGSPASGCTSSSLPADSSCSGGNSALVEWTSLSEIPIWKWTLTPAQLDFMKGCRFRPLLRLASLPSAGIRLRWSVPNLTGSGEMLRTEQTLLDPSLYLAPLPAVRLPPEWMGGGPYDPLDIQLLAECSTAGVKTLNIDFVHLLPAESFQHLRPLGGLGAGYTLISDGRENKVYASQNTGGSKHLSHALTGGPILLYPGRENRIYCLYETAAGAPVDSLIQVAVIQRARIQQP